MVKKGTKRARTQDLVSRDYTVNLHKRLHGITFKKKAPRAIREIKVQTFTCDRTPTPLTANILCGCLAEIRTTNDEDV